MANQSLPLLSDVGSEPTDRRAFLALASRLGLVLPAAGTLAGCGDDTGSAERGGSDSTAAQQRSPGRLQNPNLGAPPSMPIRGVQTFAVAAGGGLVFELVCDVPGEFPFVNHGFGHGQKGAIGFLVVEE